MEGEGSKTDGLINSIKGIVEEAVKTGVAAAGTVVVGRSAEAIAEATKPRKKSSKRPTNKAAKKGGAKAAKKRAGKKKAAAKKKTARKSKKSKKKRM